MVAPIDRSPCGVLVGRAGEEAWLRSALAEGRSPVLVCGPPGVGKSALVEAFVRDALERRAVEHVWRVEVVRGDTAAGVRERTARAAGWLGATASDDAWAAALERRAQMAGDALLVVERCERAPERVEALLPTLARLAGEVRVVLVSRVQLPFPRAECTQTLWVGGLGQDAAVALLAERAREAGASVDVASEAVRSLALRLDGLPLALELIAPRLRAVSAEALLARLDRRFGWLTATEGADPTLRSVEEVFEESWQSLEEPLRGVLVACAALGTHATLDDVEDVLGDDGAAALAGVQALVERSWVRREGGAAYRLLETVREFVAARTPATAWASVRSRARERQVRCAAEWVALLDGPRDREAIEAVRPLTAPLEEIRDDPAAPASLRLRSAELLDRASIFLGGRDRLGAIDAVLSSVPACGPPSAWSVERWAVVAARVSHLSLRSRADEAAQDAEALTQRRDGLPRDTELGVRLALTSWLYARRSLDEAAVQAEGARGLAASAGDRLREANALVWLGMIECARAETAHAERDEAILRGEARYLEAVALLQRAEARRPLAGALLNLGNVYARLRRFSEMQRHQRRALELTQQVGDRFLEAGTLSSLGYVAVQQGRHEEAQAMLTRSLVLHHELGRVDALIVTLSNLAVSDADRGRYEEALVHLDEARRVGCPPSLAWLERDLLLWQAWVEWVRGEPEEADALLATVEGPWEEAGDRARAHLARWTRWRAVGGTAPPAAFDGPWHRREAEQLAALLRDGRVDPERLRSAADLRVVSRALDAQRVVGVEEPIASVREGAAPSVTFTADGAAFRRDACDWVDLRRKRVLRQILACLVDARLRGPAAPVPVEAIIAWTWPGQRFVADSAANRVYVAISSLRQLGLDDVLSTRSGGYLLDPVRTRVEPVP